MWRNVWSAPYSGAFYFYIGSNRQAKTKPKAKAPEYGALQTFREIRAFIKANRAFVGVQPRYYRNAGKHGCNFVRYDPFEVTY